MPDARPAVPVLKFVAHSRRVLALAERFGWLPGARYTNLRDVKTVPRLGFLDINWKRYDFRKHLAAARATQPYVTVAEDIVRYDQVDRILDQARELSLWCGHVIVVPKSPRVGREINALIPEEFLLGYSVPTRYGGTRIPVSSFTRPVHLLGGRPDTQRRLAGQMPVVSMDCNRFTLDAAFGDYFDGETFRPHPAGGYGRCLEDSLRNITRLWESYEAPMEIALWRKLRAAA
ncbi:MAG: DUF6610 family protein [Gemmatimonadota bacterium]